MFIDHARTEITRRSVGARCSAAHKWAAGFEGQVESNKHFVPNRTVAKSKRRRVAAAKFVARLDK
jgi:hypothetical protein